MIEKPEVDDQTLLITENNEFCNTDTGYQTLARRNLPPRFEVKPVTRKEGRAHCEAGSSGDCLEIAGPAGIRKEGIVSLRSGIAGPLVEGECGNKLSAFSDPHGGVKPSPPPDAAAEIVTVATQFDSDWRHSQNGSSHRHRVGHGMGVCRSSVL